MFAGRGPRVRFRCLLGLPLSRLYAVLSHGEGSVDAVELEVQPASVADRLALVVAPPQGCRPGAAIRAAQAEPPRRRLEFGDLSRLLITYADRMTTFLFFYLIIFFNHAKESLN